MEEEDRILQRPYYETTYLDDYDNRHIVNIKNEQDLEFYKERFVITSCEYRQ